ncbi:PQQ-dependent sugar dehydrogenase [Glaciecola sp. MH2013]|uniref:PQQ-dependent sugar dehydrogenase n=1 Tax=Glaciecola sp. MH2013 TaxID=2785524 RepID=UPI00189DA88F|nr:PQQ-dependent sugar dehydrogenase [Glaciecola sp. MH2013]MBF7075088.1 PQQ-dependent sugar dehydrogenase [Glaciecola sp. MH2013]
MFGEVNLAQSRANVLGRLGGALVLFTMLFVCTQFEANARSQEVTNKTYSTEMLYDDLPASWSINVSPKDELFVTERDGAVWVASATGKFTRFTLPITDMYRPGQGGYLDIEFHPNYAKNAWVYLSYSFGSAEANGLAIVRFKLPVDGTLVEVLEPIFRQRSLRNTPVHYGGRMVFDKNSLLYVTTGDGFDYREQAQVLTSDMGKTLRMNDTGEALSDNPFYSESTPDSNYVYTSGHRNPQALIGITLNSQFILLGNEHGPDGGDEINILQKGKNYGWPVITEGKDYSGAVITPFKEYAGMEQADYNWTPSIAPSSMAYYSASQFPELKGHVLVPSLKDRDLRALNFDGKRLYNEQSLLTKLNKRLRDIELTADGDVLLLTDGDNAQILRLVRQ